VSASPCPRERVGGRGAALESQGFQGVVPLGQH
jgi:hypothetical protein